MFWAFLNTNKTVKKRSTLVFAQNLVLVVNLIITMLAEFLLVVVAINNGIVVVAHGTLLGMWIGIRNTMLKCKVKNMHSFDLVWRENNISVILYSK